MKIPWFFLIALAVMAVCIGLGGGLLLPALGVERGIAGTIAAGFGGAIIGVFYILMFKRPSGA
jgi:hypothetical protein